jgi:V/A-type H+-transporting ATPase subunit I
VFYPKKMKKVTIGVHSSYYSDLARSLHEAGVMEPLSLREEEEDLQPALRSDALNQCVGARMQCDRIMDSFNELDQKSPSIIQELFSPPSIELVKVQRWESPAALFDKMTELVNKTSRVVEIKKEISRIRDRLNIALVQQQAVELLQDFDFNLADIGRSSFLFVIIGTVTAADYVLLTEDLERKGIEEIHIVSKKKGEIYLMLIITLAAYEEWLNDLLRQHLFQSLNLPQIPGRPVELRSVLEKEIQDLYEHRKNLLFEMEQYHVRFFHEIRAYKEEIDIFHEQLELTLKAGRTRDTVILEGWVPEGDLDQLNTLCEDASQGHFFINSQDPDEDSFDSIPVVYDNPKWLRPFEFLTTMFSRPRYDEIDPTPFLAPVFLFYFGFMLGDAGYGMILAVLGFLLYRGAGRISRSVRDMSLVLTACGVADIVLGILQGGFFGDSLPRFFGITLPFTIIEPRQDPVLIFLLSLVIGLIHINFGLILALYQNFRQGKYSQLLYNQISWFILQPSIAILFIDFFKWRMVDVSIKLAAIGGIITGITLIFLGKGPMGFFSLTGFLGDWLSYVRILALALATGGIAMTVNILAGMVASIHPLAILVAIGVFLVGQTFNLAIQTLGGLVHAIRLHYIEFFGKFYEGGGKEFIPFSENRMYTRRYF